MKDQKRPVDDDIFDQMGEVLTSEKGNSRLTRLPDDFYERATTFIRTMKALIKNSPNDEERLMDDGTLRSTDKYRRAKEILERIYSSRERKIVLLALNSWRDPNQKAENMNREEEDLFFSLRYELEKMRGRIMKWERPEDHQEPMIPRAGISAPLSDFGDENRLLSKDRPASTPQEIKVDVPDMERSKKKQLLQSPGSKKEAETGHQEKEGPVMGEDQADETAPSVEESEIPKGYLLVKALRDISTFMCPDGSSMSMHREDVALIKEDVGGVLIKNGSVAPLGSED